MIKVQEKPKPKLNYLEILLQQLNKYQKNISNPKDKDKYLEIKEKVYKEFLHRINLSNGFTFQTPKQTFTPYKYYIGRGNQSMLVRACLKTRFWWSMGGEYEDWADYHFVWTQWKSKKVHSRIKNWKEVENTKEEQSTCSTALADSSSSADNSIQTPKKQPRNLSSATSNLSSSQRRPVNPAK